MNKKIRENLVKMFSNNLDNYAHSNNLKDANTYIIVSFAI